MVRPGDAVACLLLHSDRCARLCLCRFVHEGRIQFGPSEDGLVSIRGLYYQEVRRRRIVKHLVGRQSDIGKHLRQQDAIKCNRRSVAGGFHGLLREFGKVPGFRVMARNDGERTPSSIPKKYWSFR
jgi:hypothetical protein